MKLTKLGLAVVSFDSGCFLIDLENFEYKFLFKTSENFLNKKNLALSQNKYSLLGKKSSNELIYLSLQKFLQNTDNIFFEASESAELPDELEVDNIVNLQDEYFAINSTEKVVILKKLILIKQIFSNDRVIFSL